jgi:hypothetical protein
MTSDIDDLKTTSDQIRADMDKLHEIEAQKRAMAPDDPRLLDLTAAATALGDRIRTATLAEEAIVMEAAADAVEPIPPNP